MKTWDCIIVGAGPAGLSAALYMGRYRRSTLVIHDGQARALSIPKTHNAPGFPHGICGTDLIDRMAEHAAEFDVQFAIAEVKTAERSDEGFTLRSTQGEAWTARTLLLATGVVLNQVPLDHDVHQAAIDNGILRYCPICDGHEHIDTAIGIIGCDAQGAAEAIFLRTFSEDVTLVPQSYPDLTRAQLDALDEAGVTVVTTPMVRLDAHETRMDVFVADRPEPLSFDVIYAALGSQPRSELAAALGVEVDEGGKVSMNAPFATNVAGLYCAGDIVDGLDQISVAMGHGAIAATKAHNWLRERDGETLRRLALSASAPPSEVHSR